VPDLEIHGDDWRGWLKKVAKEIRGSRPKRDRRGKLRDYGSDTPGRSGGRRLTFEEWWRIEQLINDQDLICIPRNACFGFGCAITLHEEEAPVCAGVPPDQELNYLIDVTQDQLPCAEGCTPPRFDVAWTLFERFTHTDRNKERAVAKGLGRIRSKDHYAY
jgi:hypothetical protein